MPDETLLALADHGEVKAVLPEDGGDSRLVIAQFVQAGVDIAALAERLQQEGAQSFTKSRQDLDRAASAPSAPPYRRRTPPDLVRLREGASARRSARVGGPSAACVAQTRQRRQATAPRRRAPTPEGRLNASAAQPASPQIASQRGHFRSRAVSVSAQAFAIA